MMTDMHQYMSHVQEVPMAAVYVTAFRTAFPDAFAKNGSCPTCTDEKFEQYAVGLKRFQLECDMGMTGVSIRPAEPEESWRVPVIEGFLEYLSRKTTVSQVEYGIDVTFIISHVAKFAVDLDVYSAKFMPEAIFTEAWLDFVVPYCPGVLEVIEDMKQYS